LRKLAQFFSRFHGESGVIQLLPIILVVGLVLAGVYLIKSPFGDDANASGASNFSSLSAVLTQSGATFSFNYSKRSSSLRIDIASSSDMITNNYRGFGSGATSPISVSAIQNAAAYKCGSAVFWQVVALSNNNKSIVSSTVVNCSSGVGNSGNIGVGSSAPTPTTGAATSTPVPSPTPGGITMQGTDGTWCSDPLNNADGNTRSTTFYTCLDQAGSHSSYCQDGTTNRSYYCSGAWNGSSYSNVSCQPGGYVCSSGKTCSGGICK